MAHTLTNLLFHVVFSTKRRVSYLDDSIRPSLLAYLGGIARECDCKPLIVNGTADHVHLLVSAPPKMALSDLVRILKANSTNWLHREFPEKHTFAWQSGYAAFSVSESMRDVVHRYIANQEEHHRRATFQEELLTILKKHNIPFDPRFVMD